MRAASNLYALTSLVLANLIPLYGVFVADWNVFTLMLLYWLESAVIGVFTIKKMSRSEGSIGETPSFGAKGFFIPFFMMHYGLFMFVHLVFLLAFFFSPQASLGSIALGLASLTLSHFISYQTNFIHNLEYKKITAERLFVAPYPRIIVMHLTIIIGGAIALSSGQAQWALGLMVALKLTADLASHLWEHRKS